MFFLLEFMPKRRKKKNSKVLKYTGKGLLFLIKSPYYIGKGIYSLAKKADKGIEKKKIRKERESLGSVYKDLEIIHTNEGEYKKWVDKVYKSDSKIGIVLGARGSGKTAFGIKLLENAHAKHKRRCYAMGFKEKEMPSWINIVDDISKISNNSFVLVDEGGILFSSRNSMSNANKLLSQLILVARHKNLTILFISQNSSNLEVNILRQADFLALKPSSLLQKEFERRIIQKIYKDAGKHFEDFKDKAGLTYIYASNFRGFVSNSLPSFWRESISKAFK